MNINKIDMSGSVVGELEIKDELLEREIGEQAVKDTVVAFHAALRAGTACTKTRAAVRGGGRKPFRQKGTGRARAGSTRSPIWRGGGVVFGPVPRSYKKKTNKKVRNLAFKRAFTERLDSNSIVLVDKLEIEEPKTRLFLKSLDAMGVGRDVLVIVDDYTDNLLLASSNIPTVDVLSAGTVNVYQLLLYKKILVTEDAFKLLEKRISGEKIYEEA